MEGPTGKRECYDCKHLQAYVSWWCTNEEATKARGTNIPPTTNCPYWEFEPQDEEVECEDELVWAAVIVVLLVAVTTLILNL